MKERMVEMMSQGELEERICEAVKESQNLYGEHREITIGGRYAITVQYVDSGKNGRGILYHIGQYDLDGVWTCFTYSGEELTDRDEDPTEAQIKEVAKKIASDIENYLL